MDIPTPNETALEITEFLLPYIGMVMIVIIGFMIKDFATKLSKGIAFSMNKQFKEGDKVESVANRVVIFDPTLEHRSVTCTDEKRRIVINFNYDV